MSQLAVDDIRHMSEALRQARLGLYTTQPNPRVGCVIVKDGVVVGEGFHARAGGPHAEIVALKQAGYRAYGATVYVTLEPCAHHGRTPPCANELVIAGVKRVVAATLDANPLVAGKGMKILEAAGIETRVGVLEDEARALNTGFLRRIDDGLPLVRVKVAASLDGRTGMANGESKWITGPDARRDVQKFRAMSSAIISGIGTVLADDPALTVRPDEWTDWYYGEVQAPWRVILDSDFRTPVKAKLFSEKGRVIIVGTHSQLDRQTALSDAGAEIWVLPKKDIAGKKGGVDLQALLKKLGEEGANEVLVEAGATVSGAFARAGLVDEYVFYLAPVLLGSTAKPLLDWPLASMRDQRKLVIIDTRMVGTDIRLLAKPK